MSVFLRLVASTQQCLNTAEAQLFVALKLTATLTSSNHEAIASFSWPNYRIHGLKSKVLPSASGSGRGFGSVFRHQYPKSHPLSVGIFFARSPSVGAVSGPGLANVLEAISFVGEGLKVWLEHAGDQAQ